MHFPIALHAFIWVFSTTTETKKKILKTGSRYLSQNRTKKNAYSYRSDSIEANNKLLFFSRIHATSIVLFFLKKKNIYENWTQQKWKQQHFAISNTKKTHIGCPFVMKLAPFAAVALFSDPSIAAQLTLFDRNTNEASRWMSYIANCFDNSSMRMKLVIGSEWKCRCVHLVCRYFFEERTNRTTTKKNKILLLLLVIIGLLIEIRIILCMSPFLRSHSYTQYSPIAPSAKKKIKYNSVHFQWINFIWK